VKCRKCHHIALYTGTRGRIRATLEQRIEYCHDARISELTNDFRFRNNVRARRFPLTLYKHGLRSHVNEVCTAERLFSRF
jgi:hypothetical protein